MIVEPWAEQYGVEPGQQVDIVGQGGEAGSKFELLHTDNEIIVFGWANSVVTVMRDGEEISPDEQN